MPGLTHKEGLSANFVVRASRLHLDIHNILGSRDGRTTSFPKTGGEPKEGNSTGQYRQLPPRPLTRTGSLGACRPAACRPVRVRHWRTSCQWGQQVLTNWSVLTGWVGMDPNLEKSFAHLCTRLHVPGHFLHMPEYPQTCLYMPEHAGTAVE